MFVCGMGSFAPIQQIRQHQIMPLQGIVQIRIKDRTDLLKPIEEGIFVDMHGMGAKLDATFIPEVLIRQIPSS